MLNVKGILAGYDGSMVLNDLTFQAQKGQIVGVLGRNGVGKSTLLKSIIGLVPLKEGDIHFHEQGLKKLPIDKRARLGIGYVPQGREIFPSLTVEENILLGFEMMGKAGKNKKIPNEVFEWFPVLKEMLHRKGGDLSGGQQQQLAIARAYVGQPDILLLDEPMEGIQPSIVQLIQQVITKIAREKNIGVVLVEHDLDLAMETADFIYVMDHGHMVVEGETNKLNIQDIERHLVV
ncbi:MULTISPECIES: urea ABC transporter ATP-binding subunit UrtE [Solibacillus]|uniref:Urea ABC transporter ATP-binding subunit UrtE n=1 Tax=Solibacillus merdavium TaxID=2762218 RepID=A0ABR8XKR4_9BACL|nr:urea ABC transporter ATP-binding subunit UrtE [Solibacillus merdavium]MBD8032521.1 urea ABC transporter ATP-binding subunit UrtE [Solibacillus merdavium]